MEWGVTRDLLPERRHEVLKIIRSVCGVEVETLDVVVPASQILSLWGCNWG